MPDLLSVKEAAGFLKLSVATVYQLTHNRVLPYYKPGGKLVFFDKVDLEKYIQSKRFSSQAENEKQASDYLNRGSL